MRYHYDHLKTSKIDDYYFDEDAAKLVEDFFNNFLVHIKGSQFVNKPFTLEKWQSDILRNLFGWKKKSDNTRRYRECYIEIPRKNGKSTLCAGIGLYLLYGDKEAGAEVYSAAADRSQAAIVFDVAKEMVDRQSYLSSISNTFRNSIVYKKFASSYKVLSADAFTKHGLNAHGIIFDELHAQPNRELHDVLLTSTGSRLQPLMVNITTAGHDKQTICYEKHEYARMICEGIIDDPTFLPVVYGADNEDDWKSKETWKKANPNFGISISEEYLAKECQKAIDVPGYENTFKRLHLNMWTEQATRWLPMHMWESDKLFDESELFGRDAYIGVDLATTTDLASVIAVIPDDDDGYYIIPKFFIPKDNIDLKIRTDKVPYDVWVKQGYIIATEGNTIDYNFIEHYIYEDLHKNFSIKEIGYDPWNATQCATNLVNKGMQMVEVRQGFQTMNEPCKFFLKQVLDKRILHNANPVLRWNASNVAISEDPAGNIKLNKAKSSGRIDGIVGLVIALSRIIFKGEQKQDPYQDKDRGLISI